MPTINATPWWQSIYPQVLLAILAGALLGHYLPDVAVTLKPFGDAFIKLVKLVIGPVIFLTVATGIDEHNDYAVNFIEACRELKQRFPLCHVSGGVSNVSFGINPAARKVVNAVFLQHAMRAGLDLAIIHPSHVVPYAEIPAEERELAEDYRRACAEVVR
mgnify:CR=1 FL=1